MLFSELDVNKDGLLDEIEFDQLFTMQVGAQALRDGALPQDPINGVAEDDLGNYIQGGYNTYNKRPLQYAEMLQLPQFSGQMRQKLEMRLRGKEVGQDMDP